MHEANERVKSTHVLSSMRVNLSPTGRGRIKDAKLLLGGVRINGCTFSLSRDERANHELAGSTLSFKQTRLHKNKTRVRLPAEVELGFN
jgi:hypothetical protein